MAGEVYIGTSGWIYPHWGSGVFYPAGMKQSEWLNYYTRHFNTVEVNNSFYRLPERHTFEAWRKSTPDSFRFAVKGSRFITHMKKLNTPEVSAAKFLKNVAGLGEKLAVVLFQLPPFWKVNLKRLEDFLDYMATQTHLPRVRTALEIRNPTWNSPEVFEILRRYNIALVFADWPDLDVEEPVTADFVYVRRHGPTWLYSSDYSPEQLRELAARISGWLRQGKDVFVYFNNDAGGFAVKNALELKALLAKQGAAAQ